MVVKINRQITASSLIEKKSGFCVAFMLCFDVDDEYMVENAYGS